MRKGVIPGLILILVGAYFLISQIFRLPEGFGLIFVGAAFLVIRAVRGRAFGFTIAGCLAIAVGIASSIESSRLLRAIGAEFLEGSILLFLLAIAFFIIHIIEHPRIGNWPIIPGICLLAVGAVALIAQNPALYDRVWRLWPIALICAGAAMLVGSRRFLGGGEGGGRSGAYRSDAGTSGNSSGAERDEESDGPIETDWTQRGGNGDHSGGDK